ncbi:MAG TPA: DNRLRE domain-containing protein [Candidatus Deferrimicrobium sp.]|nr:DNRLRE domain-containing protein [Candidatus Deferrimicrobium sp.]
MKPRKIFLLILVLFFTINLVASTRPAIAATFTDTIVVTQDAKVFSSYPDTNYGAATEVRLWHSPLEYGYLYFNIESIFLNIMAGKNFTSAVLKFDIGESTATTVQIYKVAGSWDEDTITWNNAPGYLTDIVCSTTLPCAGGIKTLNVTTIIANWTAGETNFGLFLRTTINGLAFHSKESFDADIKPTLEITYEGEDFGIAGFEINFVILGLLSALLLTFILTRRQKMDDVKAIYF